MSLLKCTVSYWLIAATTYKFQVEIGAVTNRDLISKLHVKHRFMEMTVRVQRLSEARLLTGKIRYIHTADI